MKGLYPFILIAICFSFGRHRNSNPVYDLAFIQKNMVAIPKPFPKGKGGIEMPEGKPATEFYIFNQEVSNGLYLFYLRELGKTDTVAYYKALPDTTVWASKYYKNEPYVDYYFRHPAYAQYPLVGISYDQCLDFCAWLTKTYNAWSNRKFKKVVFDLPDTIERLRAANGGLADACFPWTGCGMLNEKTEWMANFRVIPQSSMQRRDFEVTNKRGQTYDETFYIEGYSGCGSDTKLKAGLLDDEFEPTKRVTKYWPNAYGLFCMSGNVEEFVKNKGYVMGGSWKDPGYYLQNKVTEKYDTIQSASCERGFRFVMKVIEE